MSEIIEEEKSIQSFNGYKDNQQNNLSKFTSYQYNIGKMQFKNMEPILEIQKDDSLQNNRSQSHVEINKKVQFKGLSDLQRSKSKEYRRMTGN